MDERQTVYPCNSVGGQLPYLETVGTEHDGCQVLKAEGVARVAQADVQLLLGLGRQPRRKQSEDIEILFHLGCKSGKK